MPDKKSYWKQPEYYKRKTREYNKDNKEKILEVSNKWRINNPDKAKAIKDRYKVKNKKKIAQRSRQRKKEYKAAAIRYLGEKCCRCNLVDECLDVYCFHHKDPKLKEFTISSRGAKLETIKSELDKCTLLCVNCHRKTHCTEANNKFARYRKRRKEKAVLMFNNKCLDCKLVDNPCIYDFHHPDFREKDFSFRDNRSWEVTEKELKKCVMLCANCHKRRHANKPLQKFIELDLK